MVFLKEMNCSASDVHNFLNITCKPVCRTNLTCALCHKSKVLDLFRRIETLLGVFQAEGWVAANSCMIYTQTTMNLYKAFFIPQLLREFFPILKDFKATLRVTQKMKGVAIMRYTSNFSFLFSKLSGWASSIRIASL